MTARKNKRAPVPLRYIVPVLLVALGALYFITRPQVCGYSIGDGFQISCSCIGIKQARPDERGTVLEEGKVEYCYGIARTRVCFKEFGEGTTAKSYLCSEYPYEVSILVQASQFSRALYPDSKFSYDAQLSSGDRIVLETQEEVTCPELRAQGFVEKIVLGGGARYQGLHLYAVDFQCVE